MHVLPPRVTDHGIAFRLSLGGFEAVAGDDDIGCVGAAWMFRERKRWLGSLLDGFIGNGEWERKERIELCVCVGMAHEKKRQSLWQSWEVLSYGGQAWYVTQDLPDHF